MSEIKTSTVTFYHCPTCDKATADFQKALSCCLCETCDAIGKPRESWTHQCDTCYRASNVSRARSAVARKRSQIADRRQLVVDAERDLVQLEAELLFAQGLPRNPKKTKAVAS